jgi:predicted AAA+ superfamily ATPase
MIRRDLQDVVTSDLARYDKMVFVSGPRQTGKTTLARMLMQAPSAYHRKAVRRTNRSKPATVL